MAHLYLVRHAKAGERRLWTGDDVDRPLSKKGRKQAELVGDRLARLDPTALVSSPYVRCVETLVPLGERTELTVETDERLREDEPVGPAIDLLRECAGGTVLCSHGDIIPAVIQAFAEAGTEIRTPPDWRKASVWVLKRDRCDRFVHATVWPPPAP